MTDTRIKDSHAVQQDARLPCRGCSSTCPYYLVCDGKLWRVVAEDVVPVKRMTKTDE